MDAKTATALEESIEHWKQNVEAETPVQASTAWIDCALCRLFYKRGCSGCPTFVRTGQDQCRDTPYLAASHAEQAWVLSDSGKIAFQQAARAELAFLESLREPIEGTP